MIEENPFARLRGNVTPGKPALVPAGKHGLVVVRAYVTQVRHLAHKRNERGEALRLVLQAPMDPTGPTVTCDLPVHEYRLGAILARAARLSMAELTPSRLVGRGVRVHIRHVRGASGTQAEVTGFVTPAKKTTSRSKATRSRQMPFKPASPAGKRPTSARRKES